MLVHNVFLGMCYCKGINVNQSDEEAVKWIRLSANQDFTATQDMLLSMEDEEMFRSSKEQLLESLQGNLRDVEAARQKAEAMLQTHEEPKSEGGGCAIILAFLLSPAITAGGYGLYNLLSWIG